METKNKIFGYVMTEINRLTNDEDLRQELWLFFLEGNSPFLFKEHLNKLNSASIIYDKFFINMDMEQLWPLSDHLMMMRR